MDTSEATKIVLSRIQSLDPENASKIMGLLIQNHGEKELIRLAFGPEVVLVSLINQAKTKLGLSSNTSATPSTPSSPSHFNSISNPHRPSPFPQYSPRIIIPSNGLHMNPSSSSSPWSDHRSPTSHISPRPASSLSYAAVVNGTTNGASVSSFSQPLYNNSDLNEDYNGLQVQDQLPLLEDSSFKNMDPITSPSGRSDSFVFPYGANWVDSGNCDDAHHHQLHRRSCSVNDVFLGGGGGGGFGWRPCVYFARGFCKKGNNCNFLHGGFANAAIVGSPNKLDALDELLKMKAIEHHRFAAASRLMPGSPLQHNRYINFLNDNQRSAATALTMGEEEFHKFGRCRLERNDFAAMGLGGSTNSSSRQIYLTFPADSTFKEEDVSNYFSTYGPVQDVRIPYQQKRMFGFVTFVFPETVNQILAKGNPHFVCNSRILVKTYKEKGKVPDKKQRVERGEFPTCLSPSGLDPRDAYDLPIGPRMFYNNNTQEMMLRRKLEEEQAELQQAIEYHGRRLMNFQLEDLKHHQLIPPPTQSHAYMNRSPMFQSDGTNREDPQENNGGQDAVKSPNVNEACNNNNDNGIDPNLEDSDLNESLLEHIFGDNLFASPTKSASDHQSFTFDDDSPP